MQRWAVSRQMDVEGGFCGRTNKLVDSCYSFWMGGLFPLIDQVLKSEKMEHLFAEEHTSDGLWLFRQSDLQKYLLACCQDHRGGVMDKPGKGSDYYHTCYALSGLSTAQHSGAVKTILGAEKNLLVESNPIFNVGKQNVERCLAFFQKKEKIGN
jgi:prenyltransferase beta subunit